MPKPKGAIEVNIETCKGCDLCIYACPHDVLELHSNMNSKGYHYSYMKNPEACTGCTSCAEVCPDLCITVYRIRNRG